MKAFTLIKYQGVLKYGQKAWVKSEFKSAITLHMEKISFKNRAKFRLNESF